jgi:hypothetical protein
MLNDLGKKVQQYSVDEGIFREALPDDVNEFNLRLEHPAGSGKTVHVVQPKGKTDLVAIVTGLNIDPQMRAKLAALKKDQRSAFMLALRDGLMFRQTMFQFLPNLDIPEQVQFTRVLYADGITKNSFFEALNEEHQSFVYVVWKLNERFGGAPERGSIPSPYG